MRLIETTLLIGSLNIKTKLYNSMTAKELLNNYPLSISGSNSNITNLMVEFAKYHVRKALKQAANNVNREHCFLYSRERNVSKLVENSILNSYPEENIK